MQRAHKTGKPNKLKLSPIATFGVEESDPDEEDPTKSDVQKQILMAQAMFQVTDSRRAYKNFLYGILKFLADEGTDEIDSQRFVQHLHMLASTRYYELRGEERYHDLDRGTGVHHFVFNYLDYKLWYKHAVLAPLPPGIDSKNVDAQGFRFRYRTSVEHFYPQHADESQGHTILTKDVVDQFGNLCIMTRSQNSSRSNLMPDAKIRQYDSGNQSLKFQVMAAMANKEGTWRPSQEDEHGELVPGQIERHGQQMSELLVAELWPSN